MTTKTQIRIEHYTGGNWQLLSDDKTELWLKLALNYFPKRHGCKTIDEIIKKLENGDHIASGPEWDAGLRIQQAPKPPAPQPQVEFVTADCGCEIPKRSVMAASTGSSCLDCYDRLSD